MIAKDSLYNHIRNEWVSIHESGVLDVSLFRCGSKPFLPLSVPMVTTVFNTPAEQPRDRSGACVVEYSHFSRSIQALCQAI